MDLKLSPLFYVTSFSSYNIHRSSVTLEKQGNIHLIHSTGRAAHMLVTLFRILREQAKIWLQNLSITDSDELETCDTLIGKGTAIQKKDEIHEFSEHFPPMKLSD